MKKIAMVSLALVLTALLGSGSAVASPPSPSAESDHRMAVSASTESNRHNSNSHQIESWGVTDHESEDDSEDNSGVLESNHNELCEFEADYDLNNEADHYSQEDSRVIVSNLLASAGVGQVTLTWDAVASAPSSAENYLGFGQNFWLHNYSSPPTNMRFASIALPVTTYQIRYSIDGGASWATWPITTTITSIIISPLDYARSYIFQVAVAGDEGTCAENWSQSSNNVTPLNPGPPPTVLYTVSFAADGANVSGIPEFSSATQVSAGAGITLALEGSMVKAGYYIFSGWSETIDGSLVSDPYFPMSNVTLHPVFTAMARYQVTLNVDSTIRAESLTGRYLAPDGALTDLAAAPGSGTVIPVQTVLDNLSAASGQLELYLPKGAGNPTSLANSHYQITISNANGTRNYLGQSLNPTGMVWTIFGFTGDTTITVKRIPLQFNSQGGTAVAAGPYLANGSVLEPVQPSNGSFTLLGWFTAPTGGSPVGWPYSPDGSTDVTLYAHWQ